MKHRITASMHPVSIQIEGLEKIYLPDPNWFSLFRKDSIATKPVLSDLNLRIQAGEKVALWGQNARGKTTLLRLIAGVTFPTQGQIRLHCQSPINRKQDIGLMLSNWLVYPTLTGRDNLEYAASMFELRNDEIENAIDLWQIRSFVDSKVETYSSGQKSLLALARVTLSNPRLLLLDEPGAYLDCAHFSLLKNFISTSRATIVLTTQWPDRYKLSIDRLIHL